jgi:hypothetical protein
VQDVKRTKTGSKHLLVLHLLKGFFAFKEEEKADEIADKMACLELASQGARGDSVDQM